MHWLIMPRTPADIHNVGAMDSTSVAAFKGEKPDVKRDRLPWRGSIIQLELVSVYCADHVTTSTYIKDEGDNKGKVGNRWRIFVLQ
jgi:hypothetical protein